ncbi:MAG: hypothetical protein QOI92_523 [Chloroflexota bacterium]|jgi:hypothetical protein|nr:hypothetical protein [Chloroflexota bacterium]
MRRFAAFILSLGLLFGVASGPLASSTRATSLKVCGDVTVYVKATALATGLLTINGIPMVIAAGVSLPANVAVGADLCVDLTTSLGGLITGATVTANVHAQVKVCGTVTAYVKATATATGLLKIGSHSFTIGIGSHLPASVQVGADLCLDLDVDGFGRIAGGTVTANAHVSLQICGEITAYAAATATTTGLLKVGSHTFILAIDSHLPASVKVGADLCLDLQIDGYGRVSDGTAKVNVETHVKVCGTVTAYTAATATATGLLKIAGRTFDTGIDSDLPANVHAGADLCLDLTLNVLGQVAGGTAAANITATLDVCGQVTAYLAATAATDGSVTIGGVTRKIAAGANLDSGVHAGAFLKLRLTIDVFGRVAKASVLKAGVSIEDVCGSAATSTPAPSQAPGASQGPEASAAPGSSPAASGAPGASGEPATSAAPEATPSPTQEVGGLETCGSGVGGGTPGLNDTILPDTDAIGRATGIVAANLLPLLAVGLLGALAAWYRTRRRNGPLAAGAASIGEDASSDLETSGDRS